MLDTTEWPSFPVLTVVSLVCLKCLPSSGDESVQRIIDGFLDQVSGSLSLSEAYQELNGSLRLLQYLAVREPATMNPILRRWIFNNVAGLAAKRGDLESVRWLAEVYMPREFLVVAVKDAASGGYLRILQWLWENHRGRCCWGWMELSGAIEEEQHDVAEWLRSHISPRREGAHMILHAAARFGDLVTLRWVYEMFKLDMAEPLRLSLQHRQWDLASWVLENCEDALPEENRVLGFYPVAKGQLEILKQLFATGIQIGTSFRGIFNPFQSAAGCGHLDVIKWFVEEKGVTDVGTAFRRAAASGHLEVLKYLHEKKPDSCHESSLDDSVRAGSLEVVQWLQENTNAYCSASALDGAAELGHLDIVKWLLATRTEMSHTSAMHIAAVHGHLEVVKWLHENYKETCWRSTMKTCARGGYLDVVKWLHANRHERFFLDGVMDEAAANGHLEVLQWFHDNSNDECTTDAMDGAAGNGHLDVVKWLHEHLKATCINTTLAMDNAAGNGHLEVVKWLHANRDEGCTTNAMDMAAAGKHLNVVRWLCHNRSEGCTAYAIEVSFTLARQEPCLEIVELLFSNFPICRRFRFPYRFLPSRVEIVEWLLDRAPSVLIGCEREASPWNWYLSDWLRRRGRK